MVAEPKSKASNRLILSQEMLDIMFIFCLLKFLLNFYLLNFLGKIFDTIVDKLPLNYHFELNLVEKRK